MGVYAKDLHPLEGCIGEKVLSLLISQMRLTSVYFEVYATNNNWRVYWNYEFPKKEMFEIMIDCVKKNPTVSPYHNEEFRRIIRSKTETYSCDLHLEDIYLVDHIARNGLPELYENKHIGLGGHHYELELFSLNERYECWQHLPREWSLLIEIIDTFVEIAGLSDDYRNV